MGTTGFKTHNRIALQVKSFCPAFYKKRAAGGSMLLFFQTFGAGSDDFIGAIFGKKFEVLDKPGG